MNRISQIDDLYHILNDVVINKKIFLGICVDANLANYGYENKDKGFSG